MRIDQDSPKLKLNIIGCGHLGKALAKLWVTHQYFEIGQVLNRSLESSTRATEFIGAGVAIAQLAKMQPADVYMIATADNEIINACRALVDSGLLKAGDVVFHCSGALSSEVLKAAKQQRAVTCSVHPVKSFADPLSAAASFEGTWCGSEGEREALDVVETAMQRIGARLFQVQAENKVYYHAASVMVCNYLTALMEVGIQTYQKSGLERDTALEVMQPMVRETLNNIFSMGTAAALTGPIARADDVVVENQLLAMSMWNAEYADIYARLGSVALELSREQGKISEEAISRVREVLQKYIPKPLNS
jgi:predicted short-subunit dehydrogenase-like oxidoreductase (DUF2520 family)